MVRVVSAQLKEHLYRIYSKISKLAEVARSGLSSFREKRSLRARKWKRSYEIEGVVKGKSITAVPDTGDEINIMAESLVTDLRLTANPLNGANLWLASGRIIKTKGTVEIPWQYAGERKTCSLLCHVPADCTSKLILRSKFLGTNFRHRLKTFLRPVTSLL
jgi:hypothetical protein